MMTTTGLAVGVVVERRRSSSPWVDALWVPVAVLPGAPDLAPFTSLGTSATGERLYAGSFLLELHRTDTATYRDNLFTGAPRIWVALRPNADRVAVVGVTADPAEGESYTEAGSDIIETVPMDPEIERLLAAFVTEHHVERAFIKRRRRRWASDEDEDMA
jgi:hypothetical protein